MNDGCPSGRQLSNCFGCQTREESEWCVLDEQDVAVLNRSKVPGMYEPGQALFHEGTPCTGVYCVEDGTIALTKRGHDGNRVISRLMHAGSTLGYVAYFSKRPYAATAEAITRSKVCFIRNDALDALLERNPALAFRFTGTLAKRVTEEQDSKVEAMLHPLRARVAHLLLLLRDRFGEVDDDGTITIHVPLSRQEIASLVGARPESISRVIRQLEEQNVAQFRGRDVVVPDLDPLMDAAELLEEL